VFLFCCCRKIVADTWGQTWVLFRSEAVNLFLCHTHTDLARSTCTHARYSSLWHTSDVKPSDTRARTLPHTISLSRNVGLPETDSLHYCGEEIVLLEASESFCWAGLNDSLFQVFLYVCVCDSLTMLLVLHDGIVSRSLAGSSNNFGKDSQPKLSITFWLSLAHDADRSRAFHHGVCTC